jgi:phosphoesterase RecJ-like protein
MMSRLFHDPTHDLVTTYILEKDFAYGTTVDMSDMTSGFSNFLNAVSGQAGTVMILQELPSGEVKGSLRSVDKDVSAMAKLLGGGGHAKAAGFTVRGRIQETEKGPKITGSDQPVGTLGF